MLRLGIGVFASGEDFSPCRLQASLTRSAAQMRTPLLASSLGERIREPLTVAIKIGLPTRSRPFLLARQEKPKSNTMFGLGFFVLSFRCRCRRRFMPRKTLDTSRECGRLSCQRQTIKPLGAWVVGFFAYHPHPREACVKSTVE